MTLDEMLYLPWFCGLRGTMHTNKLPEMTHALLGLGGLGSHLALHWQQGLDVPFSVLVRPKGMVRRRGFFETLRHGPTATRVLCYQTPHAPRPIDLAWVTCRTYDLAASLKMLAPRLAERAVVIITCCGLGYDEMIIDYLPTQSVLFFVAQPQAHHREQRPRTTHVAFRADVGAFSGPSLSPSTQKHLQLMLSLAQYQVRWHSNIQPVRALKWAIDCSVAALSAHRRTPYGRLLEDPDAQMHIKQLGQEAWHVLHQLTPGVSQGHLWKQTTAVMQQVADHQTIRDPASAQAFMSELPFLNGFLLDQADQLGLACPVQSRLLKSLHQQHQTH